MDVLLHLLATFGLSILIFTLTYILLWFKLDSNVDLFFKMKYGKNISTLCGKVVWITGASSGSGRSLAILLASHGVKLILSARRIDELQTVRKECLIASNGKLQEKDVLELTMDVVVITKHEELLQTVIKHFGRLDILVSNAGRSIRGNWVDIDLNVDKALFELNVFSAIHLSRTVSRYFLKNKINGQIAVTSSSASLTPTPNMSTYIAAKSALNAYFYALNLEHPQIRTTVYCVGPFVSEICQNAFTACLSDKNGISTKSKDTLRRMTSERSAELFAAAIANDVSFCWAGLFPFNFMVYLRNYPTLYKMGEKFLNWRNCISIKSNSEI